MGTELMLLSLEVLIPVPTLDNIFHRGENLNGEREENKNDVNEGVHHTGTDGAQFLCFSSNEDRIYVNSPVLSH